MSARFLLRAYTRVRSVVGIAALIPHTMVCSVVVIALGFLELHDVASAVIRFWARIVLWLFGIRVVTSGENNLPEANGGIVIFNHQSLFDIPVIVVSTLKHIRFGAKIELFSIPFFGAAMRAAGTLPIARDNRAAVMRIYKEAEARFRKNTLFVLAPEGTRQKQPIIGRFKKGPFIFAVNAGVPIIPLVLKGTHAVLPKKSLTINVGRFRRYIHLEFLPPIETKGSGLEVVEKLVEFAHAKMTESYDRLPADA